MMWQLLIFAFFITGSMAGIKPGPCVDVAASPNFDPTKVIKTWKLNYHTFNPPGNIHNQWTCGTISFASYHGVLNRTLNYFKNGTTSIIKTQYVPIEGKPPGYYRLILEDPIRNTTMKVAFYESDDFQSLIIYQCLTLKSGHMDSVVILSQQNEIDEDVKDQAEAYFISHNETFEWYKFDNSGCTA